MKYAYIEEEIGIGSGPVTGLNRGASLNGESEGECSPQELVWGMEAQYYTVVEWVFTPCTQEEFDALSAQKDKDAALGEMKQLISQTGDDYNAKPFPYTKDTTDYLFSSDKSSIQGTKNDLVDKVDKSQPIRTFVGTVNEGKWKCAEADGTTIVYVSFTMEEFITFADTYYMRWSDNFTTYSGHIDAVTAIYDDAEKTADDIKVYDYSQGWK